MQLLMNIEDVADLGATEPTKVQPSHQLCCVTLETNGGGVGGAMKLFASVAVLQPACWCILSCLQTPGSQCMNVRLFNHWNEIWN